MLKYFNIHCCFFLAAKCRFIYSFVCQLISSCSKPMIWSKFIKKLSDFIKREKSSKETSYCFRVELNAYFSLDSMSMSSPMDMMTSPSPLIPLGQIKQEPDLHTPSSSSSSSRRRAKLKPDLKLKVVI